MIHIEDNFFKDPYLVRNIALKAKYFSNTSNESSWPGFRCEDVPDEIQNYIISAVRYYTKNSSLTFYTPSKPSFQYILGNCKEGRFHRDDTAYTCMIYLSIDAPDYSGTEICDDNSPSPLEGDDICDAFDKNANLKREFYRNPQDFLKAYKYGRILKKINSSFDPIIKVPNKFNRMILFPGYNHHRAQKYFGTSIENARLILISFIQ
tara:strand:+ start:1010 stop:1630 length:621 start_codon:yes stop_codon:yes gene_type:complete